MGSPGSHPLDCLTSSDGWALDQEHILGVPGGWAGVQKSLPGPRFWLGKWRVPGLEAVCLSNNEACSLEENELPTEDAGDANSPTSVRNLWWSD
eukprot:117124-Pelagomonas_calceolata.AAC.1